MEAVSQSAGCRTHAALPRLFPYFSKSTDFTQRQVAMPMRPVFSTRVAAAETVGTAGACFQTPL